jgi:hypothetical protein
MPPTTSPNDEAHAEAVLTALRHAYPANDNGIDFDAIMQAHRRRATPGTRTRQPSKQLQLFAAAEPDPRQSRLL